MIEINSRTIMENNASNYYCLLYLSPIRFGDLTMFGTLKFDVRLLVSNTDSDTLFINSDGVSSEFKGFGNKVTISEITETLRKQGLQHSSLDFELETEGFKICSVVGNDALIEVFDKKCVDSITTMMLGEWAPPYVEYNLGYVEKHLKPGVIFDISKNGKFKAVKKNIQDKEELIDFLFQKDNAGAQSRIFYKKIS